MTEDETARFHELKAFLMNSFAKYGIMEIALLNGGGKIEGKPHRHHDYVQDARNVIAEAEYLAGAVIRDERAHSCANPITALD